MVNNSFKEKISKYFKKYFAKLLPYAKILILILILLSSIYLLERFILYNIIYYVLYLILYLLRLEKYNIFSLGYESFILLIYLHILLARVIILSVVFIQGGFFKRLLVHDQYYSFINSICDYAKYIIEDLGENNYNDFEYFINKFKILKISLDNIKLKQLNLQIPELYFENFLNDVLTKYNNYQNNTSEEENLKNLIESLKIFSNIIKIFPSYSIIQKLFSFNYIQSLMLMEEYMMISFETHSIEKRNINKDFDIYILSPKYKTQNDKTLAIFCNQNAICCEFYSVSKDNIYYYLTHLNCTVILWNYKGFGLRKGFTTFGNIDKDVDIFSNYIKNNFNDYKIIIHGCSIGGYSSIKLTQKISLFNENVALICDRTFGDIKNFAEVLKYHRILTFLYDVIFPKIFFKHRNIENYIDLPYDKKLILFDTNDEIIYYNPASLVFNITKKYYKDIIKPKLSKYKQYLTLIKNSNKLSEKLKQLAVTCNDKGFDENGRIFIQHLYNYINSIEEFFMFFIIFGFPFNRFKEINPNINKFENVYTKIPNMFKKFTENNNMIDKEISDILRAFNLLFVKLNLNNDIKDDDIFNLNYDNNNNFFLEKNHKIELRKYFGYIHRIQCGHNGKLKDNDFRIIKEFLKNNNII